MAQDQVSPILVRDTKVTTSGVLLPVMSGLVAAIVIFLVVAFFKGWTFNFYANVLFGFYALTKQVWVSVVLLGVIQTLIMIPFRMIRLMQSQHIRKFQDKISELEKENQQIAKVKKIFRHGNLTFLFYVVDFMVQLVLFVSIGRLFLTDFYNQKIDPSIFLKFIPYPEYPLQGLWFKIPYPAITQSRDFGWWVVILVWFVILLSHGFIYLVKWMKNRVNQLAAEKAIAEETSNTKSVEKDDSAKDENPGLLPTNTSSRSTEGKQAPNLLGSSTLVVFIISYFLVRRFPLDWEFRIFSGDVSIPNRTLNTVTALATFILVVWFGLQDISRQGKLAKKKCILQQVIDLTQAEMFKKNLFNGVLIGLGAFFVTNLIPSAFELSIFTFELIAILSPFTIDRFVLKIKPD